MGFPAIPSDLLVQADLNKYLGQMNSNAWAQAQQAQNTYLQGIRNAPAEISHPSPHQRAYVLFLGRLGGIKGPYIVKGEDYVWTHVEAAKNLVHVFFLLNGQSGHVTEDVNLFPSDTLITQFRMLL